MHTDLQAIKYKELTEKIIKIFYKVYNKLGYGFLEKVYPVKQLDGSQVYYTYVLQSKVDGKFYTGFTKNLKLRFEQHNEQLVESTKSIVPLKLIYYEACLDRSDATKREKYLKTYHGKMFIKKRLKSYLTG